MALPRNVDAYLSHRYYDKRLPGSFTSASKLHRVIRSEGKYHIPLKRIEKWAEGQDILTLHKSTHQRQPAYRRLVMPGSNHLWDADLLVLNGRRFVESNSGYSYILVTVDVFNRICRARAVKNKGAQEMVGAFESIFAQTTHLPGFIRSDHGNEFSNARVQELFKKRGIKHYYANTETKSNYVEILIKTLKKRLFQFFQRNNSYRYVDDLQAIVKAYNDTFHQSIGRPPSGVTPDNEQEVWDYQYVQHSQAYRTSLKRALKRASGGGGGGGGGVKQRHREKPPFKYSIGQTVRVAYFKSKPFDRAYDEQFTGEVFTVRKREMIENIPIYFLNDYGGEAVKGHFYESEITPVRFDENALFKIEKVVKTRVRNGVKESLVKFQSWDSRYNQWLPTSSLVQLKGKRDKHQGGRGGKAGGGVTSTKTVRPVRPVRPVKPVKAGKAGNNPPVASQTYSLRSKNPHNLRSSHSLQKF